MNTSSIIAFARQKLKELMDSWDQFWFAPRLPNTLGLIRILTGAMLLYSHLVLATELTNFLGDDAWINNTTASELHDGKFAEADWGRSYLWHISNPSLLWAHHGLAIAVTTAMIVGFMTRVTVPAAWLLQLMYIHRLTGALFGLDQIVTYCAMYLAFSNCGSVYSIDAKLRARFDKRGQNGRLRSFFFPRSTASVANNMASRLLQLHLCVIYLFGGLAKARGEFWWDGTAVWYAIGNYEYQSMDITWLSNWPRVFSAMSHATMFWEVFYCALIWHRKTRWIALSLAVAVHGGIALFMGMATFGIMMIIANLVFIQPNWLLRREEKAEFNALLESSCESTTNKTSASEQSPDQIELQEKLARRSKKISQARRRLKKREAKMKEREEVYRSRVARLKKREAKIKRYAEARRKKKAAKQSRLDEQPPEA